MGFLLVCGVDYDSYNQGAKYVSYLLTPATVCLAVPLYEQFEVLKKNWQAVLAGIISAWACRRNWGDYVPVTAAVIIITGVLGNVLAEPVLRLFRIGEPVAKGIAPGTASHASELPGPWRWERWKEP